MASVTKIRMLLKTIQQLAIHLTDEEISDIGKILLKATQRLEGTSYMDCSIKSCIFNDGENHCYHEGNPKEDKKCTRKW